jgi:hypothetical protein
MSKYRGTQLLSPEQVELAGELAETIETRERQDGTTYYTTLDPRTLEAVKAAHDYTGMLWDSWRWKLCRRVLASLADWRDGFYHDDVLQLVDNAVDVYNADLLDWIGSDTARPQYVAEAISEYGDPRDGMHGIQMGMYAELMDITNALVEWLREHTEGGETGC